MQFLIWNFFHFCLKCISCLNRVTDMSSLFLNNDLHACILSGKMLVITCLHVNLISFSGLSVR